MWKWVEKNPVNQHASLDNFHIVGFFFQHCHHANRVKNLSIPCEVGGANRGAGIPLTPTDM